MSLCGKYLILPGDVALMSVFHLFESVFQTLDLSFHCLNKLKIPLGTLVQNLDGLTHILNLVDKLNSYLMHAPISPQQIPRMCNIVLGNKAFSDSDSDSDIKLYIIYIVITSIVLLLCICTTPQYKYFSVHAKSIACLVRLRRGIPPLLFFTLLKGCFPSTWLVFPHLNQGCKERGCRSLYRS